MTKREKLLIAAAAHCGDGEQISRIVNAVLAELRELTAEMLAAGEATGIDTGLGAEQMRYEPARVWRAMLDALLSERPAIEPGGAASGQDGSGG